MTFIANNNAKFGHHTTRANVAKSPKNAASKNNKSLASSSEEASESASEQLAETVKTTASRHSTRSSHTSSTLTARLLNKLV